MVVKVAQLWECVNGAELHLKMVKRANFVMCILALFFFLKWNFGACD